MEITKLDRNQQNKNCTYEIELLQDSGSQSLLSKDIDTKSNKSKDRLDLERESKSLNQQIPFEVLSVNTVDDIINLLPFGRFQYVFSLTIFIHFCTAACLTYNFSYLLMYPQYQCLMSEVSEGDSKHWQSCTREQVCSQQNNFNGNLIEQWRVNQESPKSLDNWITQMNLHCQEGTWIGLFSSMDVIGQLFAGFIFPVLADKYGRRLFTYISAYIQIVVYMAMILVPNQYIAYIGIFLIGVTFNNKNFISYTHLVEFMGKRANFVTGLLFCVDSCVFIVCPLAMIFLTKNTKVYLYFGLFLAIIVTLLLHSNIFPESIKYSLSHKNYEKAKYDIRQICLKNRVSESKITAINQAIDSFIQKQEIEQNIHASTSQQNIQQANSNRQTQQQSISSLILGNFQTIQNLLLMAFCWVASSGTFFLLIIFIKYLPGNVYITGIAMGFSCFGYMACDLINRKVNTFKILSFSYIFCASLLLIILLMEQQTTSILLYAFLFFILKFVVCIAYSAVFVAHTELFDSRILATSYGLCGVFSKLVNMTIPIIAESSDKNLPLKIILAVNVLAFVSSNFLKKSAPILNNIEEKLQNEVEK
eukprot:403373245